MGCSRKMDKKEIKKMGSKVKTGLSKMKKK